VCLVCVITETPRKGPYVPSWELKGKWNWMNIPRGHKTVSAYSSTNTTTLLTEGVFIVVKLSLFMELYTPLWGRFLFILFTSSLVRPSRPCPSSPAAPTTERKCFYICTTCDLLLLQTFKKRSLLTLHPYL
jgi:hypothetical protein